MTRRAPIARTRSVFAAPHTPVTSAPSARAICTANVPTPPAGADHRHGLPRLDPRHVAQGLQGRGGGRGHDRRLLEREVGRLRRERVLLPAGVLGEGAAAGAEHLVAGPQPGDARADRRDPSGDILPRHAVLRPPQPEAHQPHEVRPPGHEMPDARIEAGRVDLHQHVALAHPRPLDVPEPQHVGRAVFVLDDCLHPRLHGPRADELPQALEVHRILRHRRPDRRACRGRDGTAPHRLAVRWPQPVQ